MASISLRCALLLPALLAALLSALPVQAFVDPPTFSPPQPWAEQTVEVTVRAGVCHGFTADMPPGYEFLEVVVDGHLIDVIMGGSAEENFVWCNMPIHQVTVEIGGFPAGEYLVRIRIRPVVSPTEVLDPIAQAPLTILTLPTPQAVPALGQGGVLVLLLVVLGITMGRGIRYGGWVLVIGMLGWVQPMQAQEMPKRLWVEIAAEPGAPSPAAIVEEYDFLGDLPPPLAGLAVENPQGAAYLIPHPFRAQGGVLAYLENNPDLPRARLERTIIVIYPDDADLDLALAALAQDPYVRHVEVPGEIDFGVPPGSLQQPFVDPPTFSPSQPWAEQAVTMTVWAGVCHGFTASAPPGYAFVEVAVDGDLIDVVITGSTVEGATGCTITIQQVTVEIGDFPAGEYLVRVQIRQGPPPFAGVPPLAQAPLTIQTLPTPHAVPTLGPGGVLLLLLVVMGIAMGRR